MKDLMSMIESGKAAVKVEVNGEDLLDFSNDLINRAKTELSEEIAEARKERYLTKAEVKPFHYFSHFNNIDRIKGQSNLLPDVINACNTLMEYFNTEKGKNNHIKALKASIKE